MFAVGGKDRLPGPEAGVLPTPAREENSNSAECKQDLAEGQTGAVSVQRVALKTDRRLCPQPPS
eukprot:4143875-Lingulodinium_polyedra.AAC.1